MRKLIVSPGLRKLTWSEKRARVHIAIELDKGNLSITGVEGALSSGNCRGSAGQILLCKDENEYLQDFKYDKEWDRSMLLHLFELWNRWHLNNMNPGCEHQRALGWEKYEEHPSEPCPTCGYKFGTEWKKEEIPSDVIEWLFSLPPASVPCNWDL